MAELDDHATEEVIDALEAAIAKGGKEFRAAADALAVLQDLHEVPTRLATLAVVFRSEADPAAQFAAYLSEGHALLVAQPGPETPFLAIWFGPEPAAGRWRFIISRRLGPWRK